MNNAWFGLQASAKSLTLFILTLGRYQLFWGFLLGFVIASIIYAFIITENPKHMAAMILYDKSKSFEKLHQKGEAGPYTASYSAHSKNVDKIKMTFGILSTAVVIAVLIALFR